MEKLSPKEAGLERIRDLDVLSTIPEMLALQVEKRPDAVGWKSWDPVKKSWRDWTFRQGYDEVQRWRHAFAGLGLTRGTRVAMLLPNCIEAVLFDQAALANALTPVPLHAIDTPKSSAYILNDSGAEVLVTNKKLKWRLVREAAELPNLKLVVITDDDFADDPDADIPMLSLETWLAKTPDAPLPPGPRSTDLAALVYTSGTTGNPKGVMLTHRNVLSNLRGVLQSLQPYADETLLSVPRVYDMIYGKLRDGLAKKPAYVRYLFNWAVEVGWRRFCRENGLPIEPSGRAWLDPLVAGFLDKKIGKQLRSVFGDRIHLYISGGAALNPAVAKVFLGLGVPIFQGYGMTETSPIIAVNKVGQNHPSTVGPKLDNIEVKLGDGGELLVRGPSVMQGYWHREEATRAILSDDGWLSTGDVAEIYQDGCIRITGRIKEIIVTSTGEKVPPADLEAAVETDPLFAQTLAVGDDRICIALVAVVNPDEWQRLCAELKLDPEDPKSLDSREAQQAALKRIKKAAADFPNYGVPRLVKLVREPWTIENGMLTPTLKLKRSIITRRYASDIDALYEGIAPKKK